MARKQGQIIARGQSVWLVRIYQGRDPQTGTRKYLNQTILGPLREAQRFLNLKLQQRDKTGSPRPAAISLNQFLDRWLTTVARPRLRARTFYDYETLLRLYIRPVLGARLIGTIEQMEMQELYAQMFERGLSARTIEYTNAVLESAFRQAVRWRLLAEDPCAGVDLPRDGCAQCGGVPPVPGGCCGIGVVCAFRAGADNRNAPKRISRTEMK